MLYNDMMMKITGQKNCDTVHAGLGCVVVWFCMWLPMLWRNVLHS